jgi:serine/threonine protein kinase
MSGHSGRLGLVGRTLAHYQIKAAIGAGGMGEVFRATDTKLGRDVALKILPPDVAGDPERLARFQREARAVAALNHPNVVTLYSVEESDGVHFLTMELIEGHPLGQLIPENGLPVERIVEIAGALAEALAAAHEKGIMHRDLKPANVMVTPEGRVKVLDFGLAKDVAAGDPPSDAHADFRGHTASRHRHGNARVHVTRTNLRTQALDHRTDIFSLGVICCTRCALAAARSRAIISRARPHRSCATSPPSYRCDTRSDLPERSGTHRYAAAWKKIRATAFKPRVM